ncbi:DEAD/DEAH box helicase domain-containing protein [Pochonia chlamydosporia 170]|uniref:DNA 3'-5' helicase n=1 Tax=Pochonia chlamydosporia 170 TaxID=1380566 RepID=A0A179EX90_METCM|nr:DEAD/DEAH box helicase domain-containing protein [Pochonia chlamydosporia 170]OAQ57815.2 DEAD/DEAH box helicase domain-containing protein [Pochonia chlamydosporia 170]
MTLPSLRPDKVQSTSTHLFTPPPTSPYCFSFHNDTTPSILQRYKNFADNADVLLAQEAAEDRRRQARTEQAWRESQQHSCEEDNETTPWLKHTRWPETFRNRPLDIITASARQPSRGPYQGSEDYLLGYWRGLPLYSPAAAEAQLRLLMRAVDDVFDRAKATLASTSYRSRCWLSSHWKDEFWHRPLRILPPSTEQKYKSYWKHFICYVFRALAHKPVLRREIYNVPLEGEELAETITESSSDEQDEDDQEMSEDGSESFHEAHSDSEGESEEDAEEQEDEDDEDDDIQDENGVLDHVFHLPTGTRLKLCEALFQLSMMFWIYQCPAGTMSSSTLIHFTAGMGVHRSSLAFRDAYNSTPMLAAVIWIGRLMFLEYSLPLYNYNTLVCTWPSRDAYPSQPARLETIRAKYMLRGCYSPLSELIELKAMGRSIVKREGVPGNLTWAPDGHSFTIGNAKVVRLSEFCTTYQAAISNVQERVAEMMLGWQPEVDLSQVRDDLTCRLPGWCFLDKPENNLGNIYKAMARRAWSSTFRGQALARAGHWLPGPCLAYLEAGTKLGTMAFTSIHITPTLPNRGTEATSIRLRNTKLTIRNIFIREGQLLIIVSYNKSRASNNHAFYVVRYLRDDLASALFLYIAYIQPFLDFLANQLQLPQYHSNEFLFPDPKHKKKHLSSMQATEALRSLTRHLQTPWTLSLYRQAAIAIAKRYISELIRERNFYYPSEASTPIRMIAAGVGHHPRMLLTSYAIDRALPPRLQPELLEMYRRLSALWQAWNREYYMQHCVEGSSGSRNASAKLAMEDLGLTITSTTQRTSAQKRRQSEDPSTDHAQRRKKILSNGGTKGDVTAAGAIKEGFPNGFIYNAEYRILICVACESMVFPGKPSFYTHLNRHRILGSLCKAYIEWFGRLQLAPPKELSRPKKTIPAIPHLKIYRSFRCNIYRHYTTRWELSRDHIVQHKLGISPRQATGDDPDRSTGPSQPVLHTGAPPSAAEETLFDRLKNDVQEAARDVEDNGAVVEDCGRGRADREPWLLHTGFPTHLRGLTNTEIWSSFKLPKHRDTLFQSKQDKDNANRRENSNNNNNNEAGEEDEEDEEDDDDDDDDLRRILAAADALFRSAYALVSDRSPNRKVTQQRAQTLSDFAWGAGKKGRDTAFRRFKNPSSLAEYFRTMKQLLTYYYRVVYCDNGHFSRPQEISGLGVAGEEKRSYGDETEAVTVPQDAIIPTDEQQQAMEEMFSALREEDDQRRRRPGQAYQDTTEQRDEDGELKQQGDVVKTCDSYLNSRLACAIRRFYIGLIFHEVGSEPFRSPVLSFCAMLSRAKLKDKSYYERRRRKKSENRGKSRDQGKSWRNVMTEEGHGDIVPKREEERFGAWVKPGSYTSNLSKLVWGAQLMIFESTCFYKRHQAEEIPDTLERICRKFMHQRQETAFGHILQWRLYLGTVAQGAISSDQARWSLDGQEIEFRGTKLHIKHVPQLVVSEYGRARTLLHDKLLFGARDIPLVKACMLHDDLDAEDYGGSWVTDERNAEYLRGTHDALLRQIEQRADLRRAFVRDNGDSTGCKALCRQAMAVYEYEVQEFLKSMVTLLHVPPAPPVRAPELLSITCVNGGGRRRSMLIWEKMLMLHLRYHKSQEQTGKETDNIRFVPSYIADLLVTFLAVVQPLRQTFLRQIRPRALLSPYLWSTLNGDVWRDDLVSKYLSQACMRAQVPEFKVSWWRQAAASITKQKFTPKERANFNMEDIEAPEMVDEEELLVDLAVASNHAFKTFNQMYAGSTTLVMNTPLHRAYRASQSWRTLFQIDHQLSAEEAALDGGKRRRLAGQSDEADMLQLCKRTKLRTRPLGRAKDLEAVARRLYNDPTLCFRQPGQRDAMLAAMGPRAEEQVIVVLGTGSGKTLIVMVAAALEGAGTTIIVLPAVALRCDMLDRLRRVGIKTLVWEPGQLKAAPLVVVSAEAACTETFVGYAHRLESRQRLDRIVIDECHLTITATFRRSMRQLSSYVRRVRTQTVWLTATLPPDFEASFIQHNRLLQPRIVRESTNRPNIQYSIQRIKGPGGLCAHAVQLARMLAGMVLEGVDVDGSVLAGGRKARIIVYCQTLDLMEEIASELGCPMYTGDDESMSEEDREAALEAWMSPEGPPVIVATSALGVGLNYLYVRWVVHAGAPRRITDFSQESGRAGRDQEKARSILLLSAAWQPRAAGQEPKTADEEAMQLYLTQKHCSRAVLSQFLDQRSDWRWCMEGEDELCEVCPKAHTEQRPPSLELRLPVPDTAVKDEQDGASEGEGGDDTTAREPKEMVYTGPGEVLRQAMLEDEVVRRLETDSEIMRQCCLICRVQGGRPFDHSAATCGRRWPWINAKSKTLQSCKRRGKPWMAKFSACFMCYLPQTICPRADSEAKEANNDEKSMMACKYRDMVMPLCYAAFFQMWSRALIKSKFPRTFRNIDDYMLWLGTSATLGGNPCVQAVCVAAALLAELR